MCLIVSKFGGSSTANAARFRDILCILRDNPNRRCAVLSAPGTDAAHRDKVTEQLLACWRLKERGLPVDAPVRVLGERFGGIAQKLGVDGFAALAEDEIRRGLSISQACTLSRGEYLCAALFSRWSGIPFVDAAALVAFDAAGSPDAEATARRFADAKARHERFVVPGFYGADARGDIVTFPRNGSDITGALAAAGTGAALYENWSDVPGLMTADPDIVPDARLIPQVGYRQMRQLARAGARVLHPACLDPVAMAGIPTRLRCTTQPDSFGTLIDERFDRIVPCVAGRCDAHVPGTNEACACATVFALPPGRLAAARDAVKPIAVECLAGACRFYVPNARYAETVRVLHGLLDG